MLERELGCLNSEISVNIQWGILGSLSAATADSELGGGWTFGLLGFSIFTRLSYFLVYSK